MTRVLLVALGVAAAGCSPDRRPLAHVEGTVTYKGRPLASGTVLFVPDELGPAATAEIGGDGRYRLGTYAPGDGAVAGRHKVAVEALEELPAGRDGMSPGMRAAVPARYNAPNRSGLTASVAPGRNVVDFDLK